MSGRTRMDAGETMRRFGVPAPAAPRAATGSPALMETFPVHVNRYPDTRAMRPFVVGCALLASTPLPGGYVATLALLHLPSPSPAATAASAAYVLASSAVAAVALAMAAWRLAR